MTNNNTNYCNHTDSERSFLGTWGVPELELALKHGYKILRYCIKNNFELKSSFPKLNFYFRVFSVFHYEKYFEGSKSNPNHYFNGYVNTFLKMKLEATGYPPQYQTPVEKQNYVDEIFERENIRLDPKNVAKNIPMKTISKLFLNSLYG